MPHGTCESRFERAHIYLDLYFNDIRRHFLLKPYRDNTFMILYGTQKVSHVLRVEHTTMMFFFSEVIVIL